MSIYESVSSSAADISESLQNAVTKGFDAKLVMQVAGNMSKASRAFLNKNLLIIIGIALYLCFILLATFFYAPSYRSCLTHGGGGWSHALVASCHLLLLLCAIAYALSGPLRYSTNPIYKVWFERVLLIVVLATLAVHFRLLIVCGPHRRDGKSDNSGGPDGNEGREVTREVNKSARLRRLSDSYAALRLGETTVNALGQKIRRPRAPRTPLSACANFYDGSIRAAAAGAGAGAGDQGEDAASGGGAPKLTNLWPGCTRANGDSELKCISDPDPLLGAPTLSEFYVMTSNMTCVLGNHIDAYVTPKLIPIVLAAGARCLDFDVFPSSLARDAVPVVTVARDRDNKNMMHNRLPLQDCFEEIARDYFLSGDSSSHVPDPLFIHLNVHSTVNHECCDRIALMIRYYFNEFAPGRLLDPEYNYTKINLGRVPICALFGRVIVMVRAVGASRGKASSSISLALREVTNCLAGENIRDKEWKEIQAAQNYRELREKNRTNLCYVRASMFPYSHVSTESGASSNKKAAAAAAANAKRLGVESPAADDHISLLLRQTTINTDPTEPMRYGCQFVAMNFNTLDSDMSKYLSFFTHASFILKPMQLRRRLVQYTEPIQGRFVTGEPEPCENDEITDPRERAAKCRSKQAEVAVKTKQADLQASYSEIKRRSETVKERDVFYNAPANGQPLGNNAMELPVELVIQQPPIDNTRNTTNAMTGNGNDNGNGNDDGDGNGNDNDDGNGNDDGNEE